MKLTYITILTLMLLCSCVTSNIKSDSKPIAIVNTSIVDVENGFVLSNQTIIVEKDRITAISNSPDMVIPPNTSIINGQGKFVIPGLWDMHVHLEMATKSSLPLFIANGVTGVRDMGTDSFDTLMTWKSEINRGELTGPHILSPGPMLDGPFFTDELRLTVNTAEEGLAGVDSLVNMGVDFIKVHQQISREAFFAVANQAQKQNITFVGHRPNVVNIPELVEAGQKGIEHIFSIPDTASVSYALLRENEVSVTPTLLLIEKIANYHTLSVETDPRANLISSSLIDLWKKQTEAWGMDIDRTVKMMNDLKPMMLERVRLLKDAGVEILAGTDLAVPFVYPGSSLHEELEMLVQAGLSPLEALQAATINPARFLNKQETVGSVKEGMSADLVLLDANPLDNISNTKNINVVIFKGKVFDQEEIKKILK